MISFVNDISRLGQKATVGRTFYQGTRSLPGQYNVRQRETIGTYIIGSVCY